MIYGPGIATIGAARLVSRSPMWARVFVVILFLSILFVGLNYSYQQAELVLQSVICATLVFSLWKRYQSLLMVALGLSAVSGSLTIFGVALAMAASLFHHGSDRFKAVVWSLFLVLISYLQIVDYRMAEHFSFSRVVCLLVGAALWRSISSTHFLYGAVFGASSILWIKPHLLDALGSLELAYVATIVSCILLICSSLRWSRLVVVLFTLLPGMDVSATYLMTFYFLAYEHIEKELSEKSGHPSGTRFWWIAIFLLGATSHFTGSDDKVEYTVLSVSFVLLVLREVNGRLERKKVSCKT